MNYAVVAAGLGIILVDLALSGDNALVIGAVAARLPRRQQFAAIIYGGVGALVIRFALAAVATELLELTYVRAAGGVVVLIIAVRLLLPNDESSRAGRAPERLWSAVFTITLADVAMSLDNVLAVGALAAGNLILLAGGLTISVALLFVASALVALLVAKLSWIMDLAALILGWTAGALITGDPWVIAQLHALGNQEPWNELIDLSCLAVVVVADLLIRWSVSRRMPAHKTHANRASRASHASPATHATPATPDSAAGGDPGAPTDTASQQTPAEAPAETSAASMPSSAPTSPHQPLDP